MTPHKTWVLHDYLQVNGGAERLVITLTQGLPDCGLGISGIFDGFTESGDLQGVKPVVLSGIGSVLPRIPRALLAFNASRPEIALADAVVYSGIYAPLAVHSQKRGCRVMYCHTPPRFAFDREEEYLARVPRWLKAGLRHSISVYRRAYLQAIQAMDVVVTNSQHVRQRVLALAGIDSVVVYPPIDLERFQWLGQGDYFLSLGRLESNKRVEQIVRAFIAMPDKHLVVASGGTQMAMLKQLAANAGNIRFTGWIKEKELVHLVGNAIACIYIPKDEDFGMSAVEAMAAGKPVIAVDEGGLKESVIDGETGMLLPPDPDWVAIADAVNRLDATIAEGMRSQSQERAAEFSKERFISVMKKLLTQSSGPHSSHDSFVASGGPEERLSRRCL